jgi:hypothetical protein
VADAQVWTVIALLAAAIFAIVIEMRRLSDRMSDGFQTVHREFGELRAEFGQLRGEFHALRAEVRSDIADLRTDLRWHVGHDHGPPA